MAYTVSQTKSLGMTINMNASRRDETIISKVCDKFDRSE